MRTVVINVNDTKSDYIYIGRGSIFGNPYKIGRDGTREQVIEKFRDWFFLIRKDERYRKELEKLRGRVIGCYCKPEACHGDVIADYLNQDEVQLNNFSNTRRY